MTEFMEMVRSLDPRVATLPDGVLSTKTNGNKATLRKIGLNMASLPSEFLHTLQVGVIAELRAQVKCILSVITEKKVSSK